MFWDEPYLARFLVVEMRRNEEFYQRHLHYNPINAYLEYVQELITAAIESGSIQPVDPTAVSYLLVNAMDMILTQWLRGNNSKDMMSIMQDIHLILQKGLMIRLIPFYMPLGMRSPIIVIHLSIHPGW